METYAVIAAILFLVGIGIGIYLAGPEKWIPGGKGLNERDQKSSDST